MNPYLKFVKDIEAGIASARTFSVSGQESVPESDAKVLLFMPHPDDECIIGLLPLRLMREAGMQIINVPVTFGSDPNRQARRAKELSDACGYLGWEIHKQQEGLGSMSVEDVITVLETFQPQVIFFPHAADWNSRHLSTHHLVVEALKRMGDDFSCNVVETEFWGAMADPNLMVEGDAQTVADLVAATSLHVGEVARNSYHLFLPAWMQDNVRRGGELVGGQGQTAPDFSFATLYRLRKWQAGAWMDLQKDGIILPMKSTAIQRVFNSKKLPA